MLKILEVILPILVMASLGAVCRATGFLSRETVEQLKKLITKIILPTAIFHALATAEYNAGVAIVVGVMFLMILVTFGVGFLLRRFLPDPYRKYVPFMVSVYEGGLIAYPLYANLCGAENLSRIAMLDIPGLLFGFSIYMGLLQELESGVKPSAKTLVRDAVRNPAFIASVLGVICGLTGIIRRLIASPAGILYTGVESLVTAPMTAMILLVVGYGIKPEMSLVCPCLKTILLRIAVQGTAMVPTMLVLRALIPGDQLLILAVILYMSAPATFSMQSFLKGEQESAYAATTSSLYCLVSILVYVVAAMVI